MLAVSLNLNGGAPTIRLKREHHSLPSQSLPPFNLHYHNHRLEDAGAGVGERMLEILSYREKGNRREIRLQGILQFINTNVWRCLFGKVADSLEVYNDDEYVISDRSPLVNKFISVPKDLGDLNCAAFVAGIIKGVLEIAGFPAEVSAYYAPVEGQVHPRTNFFIKLTPEVLEREARLGT